MLLDDEDNATGLELESVDVQREQLRHTRFDAAHKWRILYVGRYANGPTDIVASMLRSLRNNGHRVFHLDPKVHKGVLQNPTGARGGYGPIYVDLEQLDAVLSRFDPHLLIYAAGGLVLDDAQREFLRRRGILTLGMTLSDPDVMPSVADHVLNFDFHTTNSKFALEKYADLGHSNTLYFPFGIDRDFVVQRVPASPELVADVACIGHATNRADRNQVMRALSEQYAVRVYGNGWELPATPVHGLRMVQAARSARIHVNFPATRAGYVNVKCGVFESVGAGAILCTSRFDEMAEFFHYGREIVGYQSLDELTESISALLADPAVMEVMRRRAFRRLVKDHLYEQRWTVLFDEIAQRVRAGLLSSVDHVERLQTKMERSITAPRTVAVAGWYGAANAGDDLILEGIAQAMEREVPDVDIVVAGRDQATIEKQHGLQGIRRLDAAALDDLIKRSTAVVLGGGGLWHDYTFAANGGTAGLFTGAVSSPSSLSVVPSLAAIYKKPCHVFGMGVGPLDDEDVKTMLAWVARDLASVNVRDNESAHLLRSIPGWTTDVEVTPDIVFGVQLPTESHADIPRRDGVEVLGVNIRAWPQAPEGFYDRLADRLRSVAEARSLHLVGIPMSAADEKQLSALLKQVGPSDGFTVVAPDSSAITRAINACDAVIAMRLHTCLLAHRLGRPVVGLAYDPKVTAHFAEVGRSEFAYQLSAVFEMDLERSVADALRDGLNAQARARIRSFESGARLALTNLARTILDHARMEPIPARIRDSQSVSGPSKSAAGKVARKVVPSRQAKAKSPDGRGELPLDAGVIVGGNAVTSGREVSVAQERTGDALRFYVKDSAPTAGDYAAWRLMVPRVTAQRLELTLQSTYPERSSRRGRFAWQVLIDGQVVAQEDVAGWSQRTSIWLGLGKQAGESLVEIRSQALRDCEDWNWGRCAAIILHGAKLIPWESAPDGLSVGVSSPTAVVRL